MKQVYEISLLYDVYVELLTPPQQEIIRMYYFEDLSLGEISEARGASRSAAHDLIRRSVEKLQSYEERLHWIQWFQREQAGIERIRTLVEQARALVDHPEAMKIVLDQMDQQTRELGLPVGESGREVPDGV